jgi:polar amino acid transport system substrate-binding protein
MVERELPKLHATVGYSSPAPFAPSIMSPLVRTTSRDARRRLGIAVATLLLAIAAGAAPTVPAEPAAFVLGVDSDDAGFGGRWLRRIYAEAFRRLAMPVRFATFPTQRLSIVLERGEIDGEAQRTDSYGAAHPSLIRVGESLTDGRFALFVANPDVQLKRLDDLPGSRLRAQYRRGVLVCENTLKKWQPADRMFDVTTTEQGLQNLLDGPPGFFHCDTELSVTTALLSGRLKGATRIRELLVLADTGPLYPYLHARNAALAPRLAEVLRQMKAEGLVAQYRREVERELGAK